MLTMLSPLLRNTKSKPDMTTQSFSETLYRSFAIVLDANGAGQGTIGPNRRGEQWRIERMSTSGNSTLEPELKVYRGGTDPGNQIDLTITANGDISETTTELVLWEGEVLTFEYTGGSSGAEMSARVEGKIENRLT
jgi:hypothetical protein